MSQPFNKSFLNKQTSQASYSGGVRRPRIVSGSNMNEVLDHYVKAHVSTSNSGTRSANGNPTPSRQAIDANVNKTIGDRRDIKNILEMNPNAELAIEIVVNGTLSPNNTLDSSLQYKSSYDKLGKVKSKLLTKVQEIMNDYVHLDDKLPKILRDAKYDVGSYALLVIPMSNVKDYIKEDPRSRNLKYESYVSKLHEKKNHSYIGKKYFEPKRVTMEDFEPIIGKNNGQINIPKGTNDVPLIIHSDRTVLGLCRKYKDSKDEPEESLGIFEDYSDYDPTEDLKQLKTEAMDGEIVNSSIEMARSYSMDDVLTISPNNDLESDDLPLCIHVPHEAIFVAHKPGSPDEHEGYFVLHDSTGTPISIEADLDKYMPTYNGEYGNGASNSAMAGQANFAAGNLELGMGGMGGFGSQTPNDTRLLFNNLMEKKLSELLKSDYFKDRDITITKKTELMQIMFSRLCANKQTQMLYVPATNMAYFAFDYDENGNGQSLIVKHKNIGVFNSILTLANTLCAINNTIDYKKIRVDFDDDETDVNKVIETIAANLARSTSLNGSRLMSTDVNTQIDNLGFAGYQWEFGEHPAMPGTNVSIDTLDRERTAPDPDTVEKNEALLIQALGSTPEVVDMARNVEYAASYFQSNLQAARRAIADQKILCGSLDKFVKVYLLNAPLAIKWMIRVIDKHRGEMPEIRGIKTIDLVREFIKSINTALPKPDMVKVETLNNAIEAQEKLVEAVLQYTIGEDALSDSDVGDNLEEALKSVRIKMKALIMREWMASNNMYGNSGMVSALYSNDEEETDNLFQTMESNQKWIINALKKHRVITDQLIQKANEEVEKVADAQGLDNNSGGSDFSSDADTDQNADNGGGDSNESDNGDNGDGNDPFATGDGTGDQTVSKEDGDTTEANDPFA